MKLLESLEKFGVVTLGKTLSMPDEKHFFFIAKNGNIKHWTIEKDKEKVDIIPANVHLMRSNEWVKADPSKEEMEKIMEYSN